MSVRTQLLAALLMAGTALASAAGEVKVADAWSRAMPAVSKVGAAYLEIHNGGASPVTLVAARSDIAERVEIHTHEMDGGMMRMRRLPRLEIPAGESVAFKPHGLHLMLFGLKKPLKAGDRFSVELEFNSGRTLSAEATIR